METPRTNKAAYKCEIPKATGLADRDGIRWCSLLNEARAMEQELAAAKEALSNIENDDGRIPDSIWAMRNTVLQE